MTEFPLKEFASIKTPFYYYDKKLLVATLDAIKKPPRRRSIMSITLSRPMPIRRY